MANRDYNTAMRRRLQFSLQTLLGAMALFAVAALLLGIAARTEEPLALWWSLPSAAAEIGHFLGRALRFALIGAALALFLSVAVIV